MSWTIERRGRMAVVTVTTNPVNAQNQAFFADLHDAFDQLERDHRDSPVVLTGTGRRFSTGLDLDEHFRLFTGDPAAVGWWFAGYWETNMRLFTYPRPTVAAMTGHAFAGGLITAAVCDHRIAVTSDASFGLNEVPIGIPMPAIYIRMLAYAWVSRLRPGPRCSVRSSPPPRLTGWAWCASSSLPRACSTGPWPSPGRHPRTASSSTPSPNAPARPRACVTSPASPARSTPNFPSG
jgi:hypothetical protein